MEGRCPGCGPQELVQDPVRIRHHILATLGSPTEVEQPYSCPDCGRNVTWTTKLLSRTPGEIQPGSGHIVAPDTEPAPTSPVLTSLLGRQCGVTYDAVSIKETGVLLPTGEGTVQAGKVIDGFGNPDLMARFAAQYLLAYKATMPNGRLPDTVVEVAPALHMLVTAAELALKADLMRSSIDYPNRHSLAELYEQLEPSHHDEAESRVQQLDLRQAPLRCRRHSAQSSRHPVLVRRDVRRARDCVHGYEVLR